MGPARLTNHGFQKVPHKQNDIKNTGTKYRLFTTNVMLLGEFTLIVAVCFKNGYLSQMNTDFDIASKASFVQVMSAMHEWELQNIDLLCCMTGRQIYFPLATNTLVSSSRCQIKEILVSDHLSEKAMRNRLGSLIQKGLINVKPGEHDKRTKQLLISDKFDSVVNAHVNEFYRLLSERFFIIDKDAISSPVSQR